MPRLVSKSLSSRATRYIRCRPSPGPTVNVCSTPACQGRARLKGSSRRPAPTHTRTHTHAHQHTRAQARARDRAHTHAHAPARERERAHAHAHARKRTTHTHTRTHTRPHPHPVDHLKFTRWLRARLCMASSSRKRLTRAMHLCPLPARAKPCRSAR